jgi:probable HAF family extracellular repeat protein
MSTRQLLGSVGTVLLCGACSVLNKFDDIVPAAQGGQADGGGVGAASGGQVGSGGIGTPGASTGGTATGTAGGSLATAGVGGTPKSGTGGATENGGMGGGLTGSGGAGARPSGGGQAVGTGGTGGQGTTNAGNGQGATAAGGTATGGGIQGGGSSVGGVPGSGGALSGIGGSVATGGFGGGITANGGTLGSGGAVGVGGTGTSGGTPGTGGAPTCTLPNGDPNKCTAVCPCALGEGQCSDNTGCTAPLVCGANAGLKFGFAGNACVPEHCVNDTQEGTETSVDCGGECGCLAEFLPLGVLAGDTVSWAADVNSDGTVVVGASGASPTVRKPFRWVEGSGMTALGPLGTWTDSWAAGVSADGSVVVGTGDTAAFRWTASDGIVSLAPLLPSTTDSWVFAVSADGEIVAGGSLSSGWQPFVWNHLTLEYQELGFVDGGPATNARFGFAYGMTPDGSTVVGFTDDAASVKAPFVWTSQEGIRRVGDIPGGTTAGYAFAVNTDGSVIVGMSNSTSGNQGFRWTASGMYGLGDLPGGTFDSGAQDVSGDGNVVAGYGNTDLGQEAFIWDSAKEMRRLVDELAARGYEMPPGWVLTYGQAISSNGLFIVGYGTNPSGNTEAWRVKLY